MNNQLFLKIIIILSIGVIVPSTSMSTTVFAQYAGPGDIGSATLEEQLQLAKEKSTLATQQGAYGSGTAMFGTNLDNTVLTIIIITIIMGGISAAFFAAGGRRKYPETKISSQKGMNDDEKFRQVSQQVEDLKKVIEELQKKLMSASQA